MMFTIVIAADYGRVFHYAMTIQNCARNGAIYASDPTAQAQSPYKDVTAAALADASNLSPTPTVTTTSGKDTSGNAYNEVTVTWTFTSFSGFPSLPATIDISRTVRMRTAPTAPR